MLVAVGVADGRKVKVEVGLKVGDGVHVGVNVRVGTGVGVFVGVLVGNNGGTIVTTRVGTIELTPTPTVAATVTPTERPPPPPNPNIDACGAVAGELKLFGLQPAAITKIGNKLKMINFPLIFSPYCFRRGLFFPPREPLFR